MRGVINKIDLITHPFIVIQGFGLKVYLQALIAPKDSTFLDLIRQKVTEPLSPQHEHLNAQIHHLTTIEKGLAGIYSSLQEKYAANPVAAKFFETISEHEKDHTEMLEIIKAEVVRRKAWHSIKPVKKELIQNAEKTIEDIQNELKKETIPGINLSLEFVKKLEKIEETTVFDTLLLFFSLFQSPFFDTVCRFVPSFYDHYSYIHTMSDLLKEEDSNAA